MTIFDCIKCKGRFCGDGKYCPLRAKMDVRKSFQIEAKQDFQGDVPNIFVGRHGYPRINVGFLAVEEYQNHDAPRTWTDEGYGIRDIIDLRSSLINSSFKVDVRGFRNRWLEMGQDIAMASKPAEVEINLSKKPTFKISPSHDVTPHGPNIRIKKVKLVSNLKIPTKVDKVVSDIDLKATEGMSTLAKKGIDEHYLTRLLSTGNLGVKTQRKLVPTRWSITAVDDTLGKEYIKKIKDYGNHMEYSLYFGSHLGNYFMILTFPDVWQYELFETYVGSKQQSTFATDHENYAGRKKYAENTGGGYYATRVAVLEGMLAEKRQGAALTLRFITDEYWAPLGVWVVREASRNSMRSKPITFASKELLLLYVRELIRKKFGYDVDGIFSSSKLLKDLRGQMRLKEFI